MAEDEKSKWNEWEKKKTRREARRRQRHYTFSLQAFALHTHTHIAHCYSTSQLEREWEERRDKSSDTRDRNGRSTFNNFPISSSPFSYRNPRASFSPIHSFSYSPLSLPPPYSLNGRSPLSLLHSPFHRFFQISSYPYLLFQPLIRTLSFTLLESLNSHKRVLPILLPMITERNHIYIYTLCLPLPVLFVYSFGSSFPFSSPFNSRSSFSSIDVFFQLDCFLNANGWKCKHNCRIIPTKWSWSNGKMPRLPVGKSRTPVNMHVRNWSFHWVRFNKHWQRSRHSTGCDLRQFPAAVLILRSSQQQQQRTTQSQSFKAQPKWFSTIRFLVSSMKAIFRQSSGCRPQEAVSLQSVPISVRLQDGTRGASELAHGTKAVPMWCRN